MRKLCAFAVPFAAAVFAAAYFLPEGLLVSLGAAVCALSAVGAMLLREERRLRAVLLALGFAAGLFWCRGYDAVFLAPARALDGGTAQAEAVVADWPERNDWGGASAVVRVQIPGAPDVKTRLTVRAAGPEWEGLKPGDGLTFTGDFQLADRMGDEPSDYFFSKGIYLTAYAGEAAVSLAEAIPPRYWPLAVSRAVGERVAQFFPGDVAGFLTALLTGNRDGLDGGLYTAFQRTGIAHIVAVSGLHVSFLAGLLAALLGKRRRLGTAVTICLLLFFAGVAGNAPSVLRAVYMQSALLLAPLLGRENDPPTSLSAILMFLLMANPHAAASVSLQLSFAAVAGIYLFTGRLYEKWTGGLLDKGKPLPVRVWHKVLRFMAGSLAATLGALAFTTPLTAYYFGMVSLIAPLANLLTLWAVSAVFAGGLLAVLLGALHPALAGPLSWVVTGLARYVQGSALALSKLPFAAVPTQGMYLAAWLGFAYLILLLCLVWKGARLRPLIPLCACAAALVAAVGLNAASLAGNGLAVSVLDVGQGQSVLFTAGGNTVLVDCGGSGRQNPGDVAADYIQAAGSPRLDVLVLTHYHTDHANGVAELMARLEVGTLLLPDVEPEDPLRAEILTLAEAAGSEIRFVTYDVAFPVGENTFTVYAPLGDGGANEEGLSVLASRGDFDVLVTGDMNAAVERRLIKYGGLPDIELLVAGHHGSADATSEALLLAVRPEYAAISVGHNAYGHPAYETMERLAAAQCEIYRTDLHGTVTFTVP